MDEKKTKEPSVRFAGFHDAWEKRKLNELLNERNIQQPKNSEYPLVSFTAEKGVTPKTERYEREQLVRGDKEIKKYKITELDDIVYNPANLKFGAIARNKYGRAVFSPIYVTFDVNKGLANPNFIERIVTRKAFIERALKYQQGTVYERQSVNPENLLSLDIHLPVKSEQYEIGKYFNYLDKLITLYQHQLELMEQYKKTMLKKMFPKKGNDIPEIRFAGFNDVWEQYKLGDLLLFSNGFNGSLEMYGKGIPYISVMDILNNSFISHDVIKGKVDLDEKTLSRFSVEYGDVLFQRSSENVEDAGRSNVYIDSEKVAAFGGFVIRGKKKYDYDVYFMKYLLDTSFVRKQIMNKAQGAQHINVGQTILEAISIGMPDKSEQTMIGKYFLNLDNLITLHQRELDSTKELKKSMLQKMFV